MEPTGSRVDRSERHSASPKCPFRREARTFPADRSMGSSGFIDESFVGSALSLRELPARSHSPFPQCNLCMLSGRLGGGRQGGAKARRSRCLNFTGCRMTGTSINTTVHPVPLPISTASIPGKIPRTFP